MDKLNIDLENCFGIGNLKFEFDFTSNNSNTFLIYAPNGTMKTSFSRTFDLVSKNDIKNVPSDRIYNRPSKYDILVDGNIINPENILVVNAEDNSYDASNKITNFIASKELKEKYDKIYEELNHHKTEFIKKLKSISQSTDCEGEIIDCFTENKNDKNFFEILEVNISNLTDKYDTHKFRYNDIFDKKNNVKKFLEKNSKILDQYVSDYKNLLTKSNFFKLKGDNSFGTYQANEILKSIEDNTFFDAGHKFILEDGTEIKNAQKLKDIVTREIEKIINDEKLKKSFEQVDKAIAANAELRVFKKVIERDNLILVSLKDYETFRKKVWLDTLSQIKIDAEELNKYYIKQKSELQKIITEAKKEFKLWKEIVDTFNSRFYVPFKVILTNQEDIILKQDTANLEFEYFEKNETPVRQKKENLINILSKGEQRAYFILQFLFEIESKKSHPDKSLIIFDDIADSFDYKNKFAIIEYIKDLNLLNKFRMIILTHNFDFYRTIASRLNLSRDVVFMATKDDDKKISLHNGQYRKDVFVHFLKNFNDKKIFISLIAFVRNIIEYIESNNCNEYDQLTSCLHIKSNSNTLIAQDIFNIYISKLPKLAGKTIAFGNENILNLIKTTADNITNETNLDEIKLENKICLAIATRLKAEEYLIRELPHYNLAQITSNQMNNLFQEFKRINPTHKNIRILDKVNLMTPENIHINAFMYEPLIDMSVFHLIDLYKQVSSL